MTDEVVIISPELEPGAGGLADYTLRVAEHWPSAAAMRFVVPETENRRTSSALNVAFVARRRDALLAELPTSGGAVLLQYSAYGFDHFGYPRWLLGALADWKTKSGGSLVIMFHEIWTFWPVLNKNYFVQQLHRRDIRSLLTRADAVFTTTASQADHLRALAPGVVVDVLPVGSNVRVIDHTSVDRQHGVAVLFGLAGTRRRALETMRSDLEALASKNIIRRIVTVGAEQNADERRSEHALLSGIALGDGFEQHGPLADDAVSQLLLSASFGISAQDDLGITKSGTFMAYAAHGLNVISPFAGSEKPEPLCHATAPNELINGLSPGELSARATRLRDWQTRSASWPQIAARFARALQPRDSMVTR